MTQSKTNKNEGYLSSIMPDFFQTERFFNPKIWFEDNTETFFPAANVKENDRSYTIELAAPGFEKSDFDVHMDGDYLHIKAERKRESEEKNERYTRKEYNFNAFSRSFQMPKNIEGDDLQARYDKGILSITVPKKEVKPESTKKEIKIL